MSGRAQEGLCRAERFPINVPVRYRIPRSPDWFAARTENVSRSGVLFRTERILKAATTLELRLELPPIRNKQGIQGEVICKGEVVRIEQTDAVGVSRGVAVAIQHYRIARKRHNDTEAASLRDPLGR